MASARPRTDGRSDDGMVGRMTFDDWIKKSGLSEREVGGKLGVSQTAVNNYRRLQRIPEPDIRDKIEKMTDGKVTATEWLDLWRQRCEARRKGPRQRIMRRWRIDRERLGSDIRQKRAREGMTFRELEKALSVDKAVLHRAEAGESLSDDNFAVLLNWLGQPASTYLKMHRVTEPQRK
jgi:transcriptional regulator with XRE-family HTH domain